MPTVVTVKLDPGQNTGGGFHPRKLFSAESGKGLHYNLYIDPTNTRVWGDGTDNTHVQTRLGRLIIYGHIPGRQIVPPGLYTDKVTVIIEW